jgi:hypothetical protein
MDMGDGLSGKKEWSLRPDGHCRCGYRIVSHHSSNPSLLKELGGLLVVVLILTPESLGAARAALANQLSTLTFGRSRRNVLLRAVHGLMFLAYLMLIFER